MTKETFKKEFDTSIRIVEVDENLLVFSNGYKITAFHDQDCCEEVWAEFDNSEIEASIKNKVLYSEIEIKILDQGFLVNGMLVSTYNQQNGHYAGDLDLTLIDGEDNVIYEYYLDKKKQKYLEEEEGKH